MKHSTFVESGEKSEGVTIQTGLEIMLHGGLKVKLMIVHLQMEFNF